MLVVALYLFAGYFFSFRADRNVPTADLPDPALGMQGLQAYMDAIGVEPNEDIERWLDDLKQMSTYAKHASGSIDEAKVARVMKLLRMLDLNLVAALALECEGIRLRHSMLADFSRSDGGIDGWVRLLWKYPAFLAHAVREGDHQEEVTELFRDYPRDPASALADYAGGPELRHRAARFLNKASGSLPVARSRDPFRTAKAMVSDRRNSIPYEQDRFDAAFLKIDRQFGEGADLRTSPPYRA